MHTNAVSLLSGLACARCSVPPAGGGGGEEEEEEELPMTRTVLVFVATAISFNAVDVAVDEDVVVVVVVVTVSVAAVLVAVLTFALPFVNMAGNEEVEREAKNEGIAVVVGGTLLLLLEQLPPFLVPFHPHSSAAVQCFFLLKVAQFEINMAVVVVAVAVSGATDDVVELELELELDDELELELELELDDELKLDGVLALRGGPLDAASMYFVVDVVELMVFVVVVAISPSAFEAVNTAGEKEGLPRLGLVVVLMAVSGANVDIVELELDDVLVGALVLVLPGSLLDVASLYFVAVVEAMLVVLVVADVEVICSAVPAVVVGTPKIRWSNVIGVPASCGCASGAVKVTAPTTASRLTLRPTITCLTVAISASSPSPSVILSPLAIRDTSARLIEVAPASTVATDAVVTTCT